jgi:signal transduction histidine kinase/FixJ family two-component response regulator
MTTPTERIIIVDDEKRMCESLTALLSGDGVEVRAFQRSPEAVEVIRSGRVDLVVTDIKMPELDGLEILKAVREIDDGIPVILMTGYGSMDTAMEAINAGAYNYLLKPVEFAQLELSVKRALEKRRSDLAQRSLMEQLKLSNYILENRVNELNALYEAGKSIGSALDLNLLLRQLVTLAATVTGAEVGSIMLLDDAREYLTIAAAIGLKPEIIRTTRLPVGASIAGYVADTGEPLVVENIEQDERFKRINREKYTSASLLSVPLRIKNSVLGVINMANKQRGDGFDKHDLNLLSTFASQAAVAIDDARQFERSKRRLKEFEILHELSKELPSIESWPAFRSALISKLQRVFTIDFAVWFSWDATDRLLIPLGALGRTGIPLTDSGKIDMQKISRESIALEAPGIMEIDPEDVGELTRYFGDLVQGHNTYPQPGTAYMAIPLRTGEELDSVFYLGSDDESMTYSGDDISLARLVVSQASVLFERDKALLNSTRLLTMGNMISEISHDLRKPLTSIKGALQVIKQRMPEIDDSDMFTMAEEEVHRMNELVRELVDFSNPNKYETTKVDLRHTIRRAAELVGPDMRRREVEYESEFDDSVNWETICNKNQILEVFLNLFVNAVEAMPDGGMLSVNGSAEVPDMRNSPYLTIRVSDTGLGIRQESRSRVFERYFTTKDTGTGLGLAVVERIISAHNGIVRLASEEGKGTTFSIYLPYEN